MTDQISQHTLEALEYPKIVARVAGRCLTPYGRTQAKALWPLFDKTTIDRLQDEAAQMQDIIRFGLPFPLIRIADCEDALQRSTVEGELLEPIDINRVLELVSLSIALHRYNTEEREKFPAIAEYLKQLRAFPELQKEIRRCIDEQGEIKDGASSALKRIRHEQVDLHHRILRRLERIVGAQRKRAGWQDDIVTQRNGRYVISVLSSQYQTGMGILHDRSQSGSTLFVEPQETVELNNRLNMLQQEEHVEIARILKALTTEIGQRARALAENSRLIGLLDLRHAIAELAVELKAIRPMIFEAPEITLTEARHPLLIMQSGGVEKVVPLSLTLDADRRGIVITGPNTGGKTVALKTVGLLVLMAQSGLPIPAQEKSSVGIFRKVFADIGDEQSIEQSLSTFSSHMGHIVEAVEQADEKTLALFDEIGAGTDPKEGAALAEAIIIHLIERGVFLVATTHYSQLKTLPLSHPELENASLEFDRASLSPTFRLQLGIPGSSYAVEIASRLGMNGDVCARASELIGSGERSLAELITSLEQELARIRADRTELGDRLEKARELERYFQTQTERLDKEIETEKKRALAETEALLTETRREVERLVAEIRRSQADAAAVKALHRSLHDAEKRVEQERKHLQVTPEREPAPGEFRESDRVRILSLNQTGEIDELLSAERARVRVGNVTMVVPLRNLQRLTGPPRPQRMPASVRMPEVGDISPEIHLRGMTVDEALESLEKFLDRAVLAGLEQIYVIHGKGAGILRRTLTEYLKKHPEVESLQLGNWNEGGAGVTVVKLKQ